MRLKTWISLSVLISPFCFCQEELYGEKRFSIPVWHPEARWRLDPTPYALDTNCRARLDGPRHEAMWVHGIYPRLLGGFDGGGRYAFMSCEERTGRVHAVTGGAAGRRAGSSDAHSAQAAG